MLQVLRKWISTTGSFVFNHAIPRSSEGVEVGVGSWPQNRWDWWE